MIVWIVGLAGSGKTTLSRDVYKQWKRIDPATVLVDGDEMREIFRHDQGEDAYTVEGRKVAAERIAEICAWLDRNNINVVCATMAIFEEIRQWNRDTYSRYLEVYLYASDETLAKRRHLYDEARQGRRRNVVGVDIPFTPPRNPDMVFSTDLDGPGGEEILRQVYERIMEKK